MVKKKSKNKTKGNPGQGATTSNTLRDPRLEVTPTEIRTRSQAMPKGKAKGHLYKQTILVQYVVSTGTILTTLPIFPN